MRTYICTYIYIYNIDLYRWTHLYCDATPAVEEGLHTPQSQNCVGAVNGGRASYIYAYVHMCIYIYKIHVYE